MTRVDVIMDIEPDYLMDNPRYLHSKKAKNTSEKTIKIPEKIFEVGIHEGFIEKTDDGYVFIGKYEDLKALKKKKH